jgi:alanine racemase
MYWYQADATRGIAMEPFDLRQWRGFSRPASSPLLIDEVTVDSRTVHGPHTLFVALKGQRGDGHAFVPNALRAGAACALVCNEYVAPEEVCEERLIRVECPLKALQDLAGVYRSTLPNLQVVAVTGSCGKTMLKDLLGHLFCDPSVYTSPESFNSQLGVALSLLSTPKNTRLAFIEMAANRPGEMERLARMTRPQIALVTNFSRRRLGTNEAQRYVPGEILSLLAALPPDGHAIIERDSRYPVPDAPCSVEYWNDTPRVASSSGIVEGGRLPVQIRHNDGSESTVSVVGDHLYLVELLCVALLASRKLGLSEDRVIRALSSYQPEVMRTEIWKNSAGVSFINGTYSHTRLSFDASLNEFRDYIQSTTLTGRTRIVFGGLREPNSSEKGISDSLLAHGISEVHAWPDEVATRLKKEAPDGLPIHSHPSFCSAMSAATGSSHPSDTILIKGPKKIPLDWLMEQVEESPPNTIAYINLAAIRTNIDLLRSHLAPKTRIMVMVKALAYGTDDVRISHFLGSCGVDILGVSYVNEAVLLRQMGVQGSIFALHASESEMKKAAHWNVEVGVSSLPQVEAAIEAARYHGCILKLHLHVDTGMNRFGCRPGKALTIAQAIAQSPHLTLEGLFTHFPAADDPAQDDFTHSQATALTNVLNTLDKAGLRPAYTHACNSAAAIRFGFDRFNMVRIGLATYGFHVSSASAHLLELRPALSLITHITGFNNAFSGETVSYGRTHTITQPSARLAVLPVGYYDGVHRNYSGKGHVLIRGKKAPMVGRICMDYMMVDVSDIPEAAVSDYALLFGEDERGCYLSPEVLASAGGSIVHELMSCLGPRVQRLFIYDESLRTR